MPKIVLSGFILVPEEELENIKQALQIHTDLTRAEAGCLRFDVTQNTQQPLRFDVYEEFADKASFDRHQQRVKTSVWGQVTVNVTRHYQICEV
ncbi:antibiotic biosynthesis monooxygenase [Shewanella mangrovi]|uniref:Antibiotic biosynthesis monooxygenase n=1 Tax=Shewanella mangrovi TaxID=1515746 RepID=A0A094JHS9_9GAMM|nr:putative quinol monooxygenase [Shewanella mangrovi]KFZ38757.1 antibiotic biosynthesis monooxygenase [Shewanella mangrovi]